MNHRVQNKQPENITILGIDTSADDTSAAIVENGTTVLSNTVVSQFELHEKWGGIVPDIAKRAHADRIDAVVEKAFNQAKRFRKKLSWSKIDAIAVTSGPGLAIALEVGVNKAKQLATQKNIPLIAVNHMEGHLLSALGHGPKVTGPFNADLLGFPAMGVLVSGGHTELVLVENFGKYKIIGETLDDAMGEAYDKVARMLGLGYPGGAVLAEFAEKGDPAKFKLPVPLERDPRIAFSFSGIKTAVYYTVKKLEEERGTLTRNQIFDVAAAFQANCIKHLVQKTELAIEKYKPKAVLLGGGVSNNLRVRQNLRSLSKKHGAVLLAAGNKKLYSDNGAMIAIAGYFKYLRKEFADSNLDRNPRASIEAA